VLYYLGGILILLRFQTDLKDTGEGFFKTDPTMQFQEARLQSFSNGGSLKPKGRSRTKTVAPSSWPLSPSKFPNLTPEDLSQAGYYYSPTTEDTDQCGCFLCDSKLGGWEEEDDPFEEHWRRGDCAWATAVCSILVDERQGAKSGKKAGKSR
jgi:hypothetical protein